VTMRIETKEERLVKLGHGSGGRLTAELIDEVMRPNLGGLGGLDDAAVIQLGGIEAAFTTDSFVVDPLFFPGGDIGRLGVFGTVNDLAVQGARPAWLSLAIVMAEGLPMSVLEAVVVSVGAAAIEAGVQVVTGDTKVVERGGVDGLILNTAGVGRLLPEAALSAERVAPGDAIIVSGPVGAHEMAVLSHRHGLGFDQVKSDCASIAAPAAGLIKALGPGVKWMRDPSRGGLATALNELAVSRRATIEIEEAEVPVQGVVRDAADMLGLDPFYLACEGRFIAVVDKDRAEQAAAVLQAFPESADCRVIGSVVSADDGRAQLVLRTRFGSRRILRYLAADQQPRIC
jgi:hydrogenase expression/formation protein HypE